MSAHPRRLFNPRGVRPSAPIGDKPPRPTPHTGQIGVQPIGTVKPYPPPPKSNGTRDDRCADLPPFDVETMWADRQRRARSLRGILKAFIHASWYPEPTADELRLYAWGRQGISLVGDPDDQHDEALMVHTCVQRWAEEIARCRDPRPWYERRLAEMTP